MNEKPTNLHIQFKDSIKLKLRKALWQFFLDHSKTVKGGQIRVIFDIQNEDNFYKRLHSRYTGEYSRTNQILQEVKLEMDSDNIFQKENIRLKNEIASLQRRLNSWSVLKNKNKKKSLVDTFLIILIDSMKKYLYKKYNVK